MHHQKTGQQLADEGKTSVLAADHTPLRGHREAIEAVLDRLVTSGVEFTADTIRRQVGDDTMQRISPHLVPALMRVWSNRGLIQPTGWAVSTRAERHGGPLRTWRGVVIPKPREAA